MLRFTGSIDPSLILYPTSAPSPAREASQRCGCGRQDRRGIHHDRQRCTRSLRTPMFRPRAFQALLPSSRSVGSATPCGPSNPSHPSHLTPDFSSEDGVVAVRRPALAIPVLGDGVVNASNKSRHLRRPEGEALCLACAPSTDRSSLPKPVISFPQTCGECGPATNASHACHARNANRRVRGRTASPARAQGATPQISGRLDVSLGCCTIPATRIIPC